MQRAQASAEAPVTLTVCGSAGSFPGPERACSSYLLSADGYRLLLDCGNGSLANLQRSCRLGDIDAVVVSHVHHDHWADLIGLYVGLHYDPEGPRWVPVYGPPGSGDFTARSLPEPSRQSYAQTCRFTEVEPGSRLELGPFVVDLHEADHPVPTLASRVRYGETVLAYSGDSGPTRALDACARSADLFICDSTWPDSDVEYPPGLHHTGLQAGEQAARAGVRRLLVSHVSPHADPLEVAAQAARVFDGEVIVAQDRLELVL